MSKVAVVYWSGTGNTEAMAMAVAEGAKGKGAEVSVITAAASLASFVVRPSTCSIAVRSSFICLRVKSFSSSTERLEPVDCRARSS